MRMEALRQTNYVKSIVTTQGQMDLARKGKQSYQGWMYARLLAFSNSDLQALYMARFRSFAAYVRTKKAACCVRTYAAKPLSSPLSGSCWQSVKLAFCQNQLVILAN